MINVLKFEDIKKDLFFEFLKNEYKGNSTYALKNMWHDQWIDHENTLPYLLEKTKRFKEPFGQLHILIDNDKIIGCGGVYISNFHKQIALCGTRLWLNKDYRNKLILKDTIFVENKKWALQNNVKILAVCFNEYNKSLAKTFLRTRLGESKERLSSRKSHHLFYNGAYELDFPVSIQNTKQWVVYEKLDQNFNFDWTEIRFD